VQPLCSLCLCGGLEEVLHEKSLSGPSSLRSKNFSPAKAQRRKENLLETRQRFAPLRLCGRKLVSKFLSDYFAFWTVSVFAPLRQTYFSPIKCFSTFLAKPVWVFTAIRYVPPCRSPTLIGVSRKFRGITSHHIYPVLFVSDPVKTNCRANLGN